MNYKLTSSKTILAKIYRDLKPNNSNWEQDAVEWIGEVIEFIGYHGIFPKKSETVTVKDHRAQFPCDFYQLRFILYQDKHLSFGADINACKEYFSDVYMSAKKEVLEHTNTEVTRLGSRAITENETASEYFIINPGFIQTSFETGEIEVHYDSFPVDDEGFPLIPDNVYFKQAVSWYIIRQMILGGHKHENFSYQFADYEWEFAKVRAENELMFPSPDKMEHFRDMWVRLIPSVNISSREDVYKG